MILDAIVALFGLLLAALSAAVVSIGIACALIVNLLIGCIELVVGLFVSGFTLKRLDYKKGDRGSVQKSLCALVLITFIVAGLFFGPKILNRELTLVASDGHSLPFAAVVIDEKSGVKHTRTDEAGNLIVSRFKTMAITVKDPRYVERTWEIGEVDDQLVVERSVLGSGLDVFADKLLQKAKR